MKLIEAKKLIDSLAGKKFREVLKEEQMADIIKNKGKSGQLLEITLGLNLSNTDLDFEDGKFKTNKCATDGKALGTMFITQISTIIDELLIEKNFYESKLYKKISNLLYVPISKIEEPSEWMFLPLNYKI